MEENPEKAVPTLDAGQWFICKAGNKNKQLHFREDTLCFVTATMLDHLYAKVNFIQRDGTLFDEEFHHRTCNRKDTLIYLGKVSYGMIQRINVDLWKGAGEVVFYDDRDTFEQSLLDEVPTHCSVKVLMNENEVQVYIFDRVSARVWQQVGGYEKLPTPDESFLIP